MFLWAVARASDQPREAAHRVEVAEAPRMPDAVVPKAKQQLVKHLANLLQLRVEEVQFAADDCGILSVEA